MILILFVCHENANRSQIAEAFGNMYAPETVKVYSAGSTPSGIINPRAIQFMIELGYNLGKHSSKSVEQFPNVFFDYVVSMGCGDDCPIISGKNHEDWQIPDPKNLSDSEYRIIRDYIGIKVKQLIDSVTRNQKQ